MSSDPNTTQNTSNEVHEVQGNRLIGTIKNIFASGKVNRIIISSANGNKLLDISYAAGLTVTALLTLLMPLLVGLAPIVLLLGRFTIEVVRPEAS